MITLQECLNRNFPAESEEIKIYKEKFKEGELDLRRFVNLKTLNLEGVGLTSVDFLNTIPNPEKLECLGISDNKIGGDLTLFSKFINLKKLKIGNLFGGVGNYFHGSLEPLKNLSKLKYLCIGGTNIEEGLEYIPTLLAERMKKDPQIVMGSALDCTVGRGKVKAIRDQLRSFSYDLEAWQLAHPEKMLIARPELFTNPDSKEKWINALKNKVEESKKELSETDKEKLAKIARLEAKISELELAKSTISQQTQTEFSTQNKGTQTDLSRQDITKLEQQSQQLLKLLQAAEQELTNTKNQLKEIQEKFSTSQTINQEQIKQLESKIKLLEQQKENYQTKYDKSINFIKEIREDIAKEV